MTAPWRESVDDTPVDPPSRASTAVSPAQKNRLRRRLIQDRRALGRSYGSLAAVLGPVEGAAAGPREVESPVLTASRWVGRASGVSFRSVAALDDSPDAVAELCAASGVRYRKVLLRGPWWRRDNGPLLAFRRQPEGDAPPRPIALLPISGGYEAIEPATSERSRLDAGSASRLEAEAYMFYPSLPERPVGLGDLLRFGCRGLGRELWTLLAVSAAVGLLGLLLPVLTGYVAGRVLPSADRVGLTHMVAALIVAALSAALFQLARGFVLLRLTAKMSGSLQAAVWDRLLALPVAFFRRYTVGDLESRAMGVDKVRELVGDHVTSSLLALSYGVFSFALLFAYSVRLALFATALVLALGATTVLFALLELRHQRALQQVRGRLASLLHALLSGVAKLRVSGAEQRAFAVWATGFAEQRRHTVAAQRLTNIRTVLASIYGVLGSLLLFALVGYSARSMSTDDFLVFATAFAQLQAVAASVVAVLPQLLATVPVYERMKPILTAVPELSRAKLAEGHRDGELKLSGKIELEKIAFRYDPAGPRVLDGVSLRAEPGELVALVGPSGSGKTTCLRLMLGFETPEAGCVLFDDQELSSLDIRSVRRQLGVVLQNGRPLVGDIFHNIIGGRRLTLDDAWWAARKMALEEDIKSLPMGMHTYVNARGATFSGGQRQRLLLARAIVYRPRILLLDEALSALDNRTQEIVARNLDQLKCTRIVVAHRLSTIKNADRIYVMERGRVVEGGTFSDLLAQGGLFAQLARRQIV